MSFFCIFVEISFHLFRELKFQQFCYALNDHCKKREEKIRFSLIETVKTVRWILKGEEEGSPLPAWTATSQASSRARRVAER